MGGHIDQTEGGGDAGARLNGHMGQTKEICRGQTEGEDADRREIQVPD